MYDALIKLILKMVPSLMIPEYPVCWYTIMVTVLKLHICKEL